MFAFVNLILFSYICSAKPLHILITDFEPFDGDQINGSQLVSKALRNLPAGDIVYSTCTLPVVYDKAPAVALACIDKMEPKPDIVLSLGQGVCDTRLEAKGYNQEAGFMPDNAGQAPFKKIDEAGPEDELVGMPVGEMYCALPPTVRHKPQAALSIDPGYYVCNDVIFSLANKLKSRKIPTAFLHVPSFNVMKTHCETNPQPKDVASNIHKMVTARARSLNLLPNPTQAELACARNRLSGSHGNLQAISQVLHKRCLALAANELFKGAALKAKRSGPFSYQVVEDALEKMKSPDSAKERDVLNTIQHSQERLDNFDRLEQQKSFNRRLNQTPEDQLRREMDFGE